MSQRAGKSGFPHKPARRCLPSGHRFGMLSGCGRQGCHDAMLPPVAANNASHTPFHHWLGQ
jgi:hypothetical protein